MTQPDLRKNFELTVDVNHKDLLNFELFMDCVPLCDKHSRKIPKGKDMETMHYECKDCEKVYNKWYNSTQRIECKLWEEFCKKAGWD